MQFWSIVRLNSTVLTFAYSERSTYANFDMRTLQTDTACIILDKRPAALPMIMQITFKMSKWVCARGWCRVSVVCLL